MAITINPPKVVSKPVEEPVVIETPKEVKQQAKVAKVPLIKETTIEPEQETKQWLVQ
jgi:hypothetical protein